MAEKEEKKLVYDREDADVKLCVYASLERKPTEDEVKRFAEECESNGFGALSDNAEDIVGFVDLGKEVVGNEKAGKDIKDESKRSEAFLESKMAGAIKEADALEKAYPGESVELSWDTNNLSPANIEIGRAQIIDGAIENVYADPIPHSQIQKDLGAYARMVLDAVERIEEKKGVVPKRYADALENITYDSVGRILYNASETNSDGTVDLRNPVETSQFASDTDKKIIDEKEKERLEKPIDPPDNGGE